ncbi:uncharacterized protein LOC131381120 isoform X3 [Hylobates moloch]|uniref:uncharacterized protein LOC131381120 isoform X3 n=1 Tax=Hylobates moloch TaxID=81572 RepID=UPI002674650A|nr:uncharacterized protein LOC131381120 isoform X3 [Hylobates moloch]
MALHRSHGSSSVLESSEGGFLSHVQPDEFTVSSPNIAELQIYYYANAQTTHTTYPDGLEVVQFLNKQTGEGRHQDPVWIFVKKMLNVDVEKMQTLRPKREEAGNSVREKVSLERCCSGWKLQKEKEAAV